MSIRRAGSIFDRAVKRTFNETKYNNLTAKTSEGYSHLSFYSYQDVRFGRFMLTFAVTVSSFVAYYEPGYFHETFGHFANPPGHDNIDGALESQERKLNRQIIEREHEEHKLHSFLDLFKSYDI